MGTLGKRWEVPHHQKYKNIVTREVLTDATIRRISDYKLSKELKVPVTAIQHYRYKWQIPSARYDSEVSKMRDYKLSPEEVGLIIGTVLGDGHLSYSPERDEAFLIIMHSEKQKEYVYHKYEKLKKLCLMDVKQSLISNDYVQNSVVYSFSTI